MARRKSVCVNWTLALLLVLFCPYVHPRPQDTTISTTKSIEIDKATENPTRHPSSEKLEKLKDTETTSTTAPVTQIVPRNNNKKTPVIGESIKMVANQLLENLSNTTVETPVVIDTRIPPKLKNQILQKHKIKTRNEDGNEPLDNSHPGEAVPVTMEELESENKVSESSTSNEGISTWILLSNPMNKDNVTSTEATKIEETQKKKLSTKNKTKRPPNNKVSIGKRPIIGSTNKSDLVAGGSAINENVYNKLKDTVLSNVQKNKNQSAQKTSTTPSTTITTTVTSTTEALTTKKEVTTKAPTSVVPLRISSKPTKKKNKNKQKGTTSTLAPVINESALLPMEPKEQEIELEISTPATTTKKPKRSSTKKKTKTKKRKTSKPKPETTTISEVKTTNKTKTKTHKTKKPEITSLTGPITSQIYNYFSREVMPSVGVGVLGLASLVGLAGYFLYPFSTPVRRTFEVDKKDDIYKHNAEEYASEGNGQAEEEMLGTVLAGMPAHSKNKLNPYAGQTAHVNRYPTKKDQDIRYRHVTAGYEPNYNVHFPQQKTGLAHGAVYSEPYNPHQYEMRNVYTTENKYVYDKGSSSYTPSADLEPVYSGPQHSGPSAGSSYGSETSNSVVYGVKPSSDSEFKPVYPFESQFYSETTSNPVVYPSTSMYLGSNNEKEQEEQNYPDDSESSKGSVDNQFVVGNVPKEFSDSSASVLVPEHGPRNLRKKRNLRQKRNIASRIEEVLNAAKEDNKDIFISNEIDEALGHPVKSLASMDESPMINDVTSMPEIKDVFTVYAVSADPSRDMTTEAPIVKNEVVESISTIPIHGTKQEDLRTDSLVDTDTTTKSFRVYEIFSSTGSPVDITEQNSSANSKIETTTYNKNMNTETTTELKSETTSTMPPSPSPVTDFSTSAPTVTTSNPEVLTYPPLNQDGGFFTFIKRLIEFKYRLGLSILQTTSDNLNRYLRSMESKVQKVAKASV